MSNTCRRLVFNWRALHPGDGSEVAFGLMSQFPGAAGFAHDTRLSCEPLRFQVKSLIRTKRGVRKHFAKFCPAEVAAETQTQASTVI